MRRPCKPCEAFGVRRVERKERSGWAVTMAAGRSGMLVVVAWCAYLFLSAPTSTLSSFLASMGVISSNSQGLKASA